MPSEEAVFEAVISWIKQDEKKRKDMLPGMLKFVRLPLLTPRYITDIVDSEASKLSCLTLLSDNLIMLVCLARDCCELAHLYCSEHQFWDVSIDKFFELFFVKKYLLVGTSSMLWTGEWMSESVSQ